MPTAVVRASNRARRDKQYCISATDSDPLVPANVQSQKLGFGPHLLRRLLDRGEGPKATKIGARWFIRNADLEAWLQAQTRM